jgi:phosphate starvation-inducible PhoH-like protein
LEVIEPQIFYGPNNAYFDLIKSKFPKLQFVGRGDQIKILGDVKSLELFVRGMGELEKLYIKRTEYNEHVILEALSNVMEVGSVADNGLKSDEDSQDVLLIGTRGQKIKARTKNQRKMLEAAKKNDIVFAIGPAGTGKTYTAVAIAVLALKEREIRRII